LVLLYLLGSSSTDEGLRFGTGQIDDYYPSNASSTQTAATIAKSEGGAWGPAYPDVDHTKEKPWQKRDRLDRDKRNT